MFKSKKPTREKLKKLKQKNENKVVKKRGKIKYKSVFLFLTTVILLVVGILTLYNLRIRNIMIIGNEYLTDQEIIDISGLRNYPRTIINSRRGIRKNIEKHELVLSVNVRKRDFLRRVEITVEENRPLLFSQSDNGTILRDGTIVETKFSVPTLINKVPDELQVRLLARMANVPNDVLLRMSEIQYVPNEVDQERFFITMTDGNFVYINIYRFARIHDYIDFVKGFDNRTGILYLDIGGHFQAF